jgi:hypothetical protein
VLVRPINPLANQADVRQKSRRLIRGEELRVDAVVRIGTLLRLTRKCRGVDGLGVEPDRN